MPSGWDDQDLLKSAPETGGPPQRGAAVRWLAGALVFVAAVVVLYLAFGRRTTVEAPAAPAAAATTATPEATRALGSGALDINVPPIDESDSVVRDLARRLSLHPRVAAWFATNGLIRNFVAVVTNIASGKAPSSLVPVLRPASRFGVTSRGATMEMDPKGYERFNGLADAVASVDPAGAAQVYATLKPRIEEAYRDLGTAEPQFDRALERAIALLVSVPVPDGPLAVKPATVGPGYVFTDPRLEALTSAQKQLLRMGPRNARAIQQNLRAIALALGIPLERLRAAN